MIKEIEPQVIYLIGYIEEDEFWASESTIDLASAKEILKNLENGKLKDSKKEFTIFKKVTTYTEI